ncbi:FAD-dependent oxidoreductase [Pseudonocardia xinjiangensis]|uniref:FAD-binding monooxygenase n=1 Tax=Pseudonocardia xinjiangensis TaxID=75289 RepID=A0ABX1RP07_9PSEU|nr:FAD-dependent monooxygenase [Pseudonocardia xinjiangensis]NMH80921.1 FAD-binding monooxygenase [Pseudonocardia xinjiangensis]
MPESPAATFERLSGLLQPLDTEVLFDRAHVLGGSIAGLLAARVLADHARSVVIVERDGTDTAADTRPGVPQGYQVHTLLPGGREQIERWFPGLTQEAIDRGAELSDPERSVGYLDGVQQMSTPNTRLVTSSRPFLESLIRRRTLALPNVEIVTGRATGLAYEGDAVSAVRYLTDDGEREENTDFVVDATGRASRLTEWLEQGGWPRPELERLAVDVRYLSARFKRSPDRTGPLSGIARYSPGFPSKGAAGAAVNAIEDSQWTIMLAWHGDAGRGTTKDGFLAECADLPPIFQEAAAGQMVGDVVPYRHPDSRRRHFADLDRFPARLVAVGDAVASFNPVFGQGMSSAALHASCLSEYLRSDVDRTAAAREFFALQKVVVDAAWDVSTAGDAARLGIRPPQTAKARVQRWVLGQVFAAADRDVEVATAVRAVGFMTAHPRSLAAPHVVARAVLANRRARRAAATG